MEMDTQLARLLDERDAVRVVVDFYAALDRSDGAGCAACFTEDGVWVRDMGAVTGRSAIAQAVAKRPAGRRTTHAVMNLRFDTEGEGRGTLRFLLVAYDGTEEDAATAPFGRMAGIRQCTDTLQREGGAWRIRHRTSTPWMRGPWACRTAGAGAYRRTKT